MAKGDATRSEDTSTATPRVTRMVTDELERLAREGARRHPKGTRAAMLDGEVTDVLQRTR
jgi:hypothetical protein